eukprot:GILJ01016540.1.p1 GENE.GILJ01016540.1~~GILJ01016540.1.p1  ORF type:complete len:773 (+),score=117.94 GILJ01016540.1:196-2319(+)
METKRIGTYKEYWYTGDIDYTPEEAVADEAKAAKVLAMRTQRPTAAELRSGRGGNGKESDDQSSDDDGSDNSDSENRDEVAAANPKDKDPVVVKYAYVLMISNHKYVDGALVVAQSLRQHSEMVKSGEADLVIIISEKIKLSSVLLLTRVFTRVKIMYTMAAFASQSYYSTTFDKIYLFWLTEYKVLFFMDADSLVTGNPDGLLLDKENEGNAGAEDDDGGKHRHGHHKKPRKATPLTAVGGGDYFQTGLLIAKPDRQLFADLYLEFRLGLFQYNQWRARDGVLMRTCFMAHHTNIEHPVDRLYHFYGFVKPWFNKDGKYKYGKGDEKLSYNPNYWDWWRRYEELHFRYFVTIAAVEKGNEDAKPDGEFYNGYVYGNSANFPDKDVPIPGTSLTHPYTREVAEYIKVKGGWPKFDALKIQKTAYPLFFNLVDIENGQRDVAEGRKGPRDIDESQRSIVTDIAWPQDYMWIQRFSVGTEYFRPTYRMYAKIFNISIAAASARQAAALNLDTSSGTRKPITVVGSPGDSCSEACDKESARLGRSASTSLVCVEEALRATQVNDCFFGAARAFKENRTVVMANGLHCDLCVYEYKSDAAPFIQPTTAKVISQMTEKQNGAKGKKNKKKHKKKPAARGDDKKLDENEEARAHYQEAFEEDDSDRQRDIAAAIEDGSQRRLNECRVNFLHEKLLAPTCGAKRDSAERVCVCF